ncbi:hypothetical protein [Providencia sp.]|uniref:hypothetical protein n=1 Tax=Providencia sp. TaxID=589 RepID=UPI003340E8A6
MKRYQKVITLFLTSSTFISFLALMANWFYLNKIGWLDLFLNSIISTENLFIIAFFLVISFFSIMLIFMLPSINIIMFLNKDDEYILKYNEVRLNYVRIFLVIATVANLFFIVSLFFSNDYYSFHLNLFLLFVLIFTGWTLYYRGLKKIVSQDLSFKKSSKAIWKKIEIYVVFPFMLLLILTFYSLSFYLVTKGLKSNGESTWIQLVYLFFIFEFIIINSVVPCFIYFRSMNEKGWFSIITSISGCLILFIVIISILVPSVPSIIINATMKFSGIKNESPKTYIVNENEYPEELFELDLWNKRAIKDSNRFTIEGISMYSFGETNLVCPKNIVTSYGNSLSNYFFDKKEDEKVSDELKELAKNCIPFDKKSLKSIGMSKD